MYESDTQHNTTMEPDNIRVTTHERIGNETANTISNIDGSYYPYAAAGVVVDETTVVCSECATEDELIDGHKIKTNDEWDYPGAICEECGTYLDTYLLVYRENDPEMWHKLQWNEQLGRLDSPIMDGEELAKYAEVEAYEKGYAEGDMQENSITQADAENDPRLAEYPTDSAHYANNIAPELRALSGKLDGMGHGTYQEDMGHSAEVFNHVHTAFMNGYYDRIMNSNEKWDSHPNWSEEYSW